MIRCKLDLEGRVAETYGLQTGLTGTLRVRTSVESLQREGSRRFQVRPILLQEGLSVDRYVSQKFMVLRYWDRDLQRDLLSLHTGQ